MTDKIPISDIKIGSRFRKDLGDIKTLAKTIEEAGCLLQPIGINEDDYLVFGARRLEACKFLGWTDIPFTRVPIQDIIKGEFYENTGRKDWTVSERVAILEEIERQRLGHRQKKGKDSILESFQQENKNKRSVDIVAKCAGVSQGQLANEKKLLQAVRENPDDIVDVTSNQHKITLGGMMEKVDKRRMKVGTALILIRRYEHNKAVRAKLEEANMLPPPPPLTDKEKQDLKDEQDRILKEAFDKYVVNENEYEDLGSGIRLIQGNPLEVSYNSKPISIPVSAVISNKRTTVSRTAQMERYGIEENSVDLIFTNPSYSLHNMIPQYNNHKTNPPSYREISYLADNVLKEGGNIIIGIRYQFHRLIPAIVYFISHNCDYERHSNYGLFHTSVTCDRCRIRFKSIIICDGRLLLLWFSKRKKGDDSSAEKDYPDIEEKGVSSIDDVIKQFTSEKDVVLDPLMDHGDIGIAVRKLGRKYIGIEEDKERFKTAELRVTTKEEREKMTLIETLMS